MTKQASAPVAGALKAMDAITNAIPAMVEGLAIAYIGDRAAIEAAQAAVGVAKASQLTSVVAAFTGVPAMTQETFNDLVRKPLIAGLVAKGIAEKSASSSVSAVMAIAVALSNGWNGATAEATTVVAAAKEARDWARAGGFMKVDGRAGNGNTPAASGAPTTGTTGTAAPKPMEKMTGEECVRVATSYLAEAMQLDDGEEQSLTAKLLAVCLTTEGQDAFFALLTEAAKPAKGKKAPRV